MTKRNRIFRIRRCSGSRDGRNSYCHADVVAESWHAALRAAREGRVERWRWIDSFDTSDEDYLEFEYLYEVEAGNRVFPVMPLKKTPKGWNPPPKRSFKSYLAIRNRYGAIVKWM